MQLTENFALAEFVRLPSLSSMPPGQQRIVKQQIENIDGAVLQNLTVLANALQKVRDVVGSPIYVISGYRPPLYDVFIANRAGFTRTVDNPGSHAFGRSADCVIRAIFQSSLADQFIRERWGKDPSFYSNATKLGILFRVLNGDISPKVIYEGGSVRNPRVVHLEHSSQESSMLHAQLSDGKWRYTAV